jgi:membrane protein required for colicin V production
MNLLDYIIIIAMVYLLVKGAMRGIIREICSLIGVILGICLGNIFQPRVADLLRPSLPSTGYLPLISFAVIFAVILILCNLIGWAINLSSKKVFLGWLDRTLGAFLAIIKGVIVTYLVIVMLTFFIPTQTPLIGGSKLAPWIIRSYQSMISIISPDHYKNWKKRIVGEQKKTGEIVSGENKDMAEHHE